LGYRVLAAVLCNDWPADPKTRLESTFKRSFGDFAMRLLRWIILVLLLGLAGCGPATKSVFPPALSIQQLVVLPLMR
jgi:hypothetical protein